MPEALPEMSAPMAWRRRSCWSAWPYRCFQAAPRAEAGVAADGAVGQRGRAGVVDQAAAGMLGGVAADGAVGQRGRAEVVQAAAAVMPPMLPLTVQLVSVAVPLLDSPPPSPVSAELPLTVQLVSVACAGVVDQAAAGALAELPLTVQLVSVAVPLLNRPPPQADAMLPLTVQLVSVACRS